MAWTHRPAPLGSLVLTSGTAPVRHHHNRCEASPIRTPRHAQWLASSIVCYQVSQIYVLISSFLCGLLRYFVYWNTRKHLGSSTKVNALFSPVIFRFLAISKDKTMGSIQTITSSRLSLSSQQIIDSQNKNHHLKTLDIGLDGNTVSANPFGDVFSSSLISMCNTHIILDPSTELLSSHSWCGRGMPFRPIWRRSLLWFWVRSTIPTEVDELCSLW